MDRYVQFAVAAGMRGDARTRASTSTQIDGDRMAVALGSAVGGTMYLEDDYVAVSNRGQKWLVDPDYAPPFLYQALVPSSLAARSR